MEIWNITNVFLITEKTVAQSDALKSTWIHLLYKSHQQEILCHSFWLGTQRYVM